MKKFLRRILGWIYSPTEERRGNDDTVEELLTIKIPFWRCRVVHFLVFIAFLALFGRLTYLQLGVNTDFLKRQGEIRFQRTLDVPAMRGRILDRNGEILATSVPAKSLWIIPQDVQISSEQQKELAGKLSIPVKDFVQKFKKDKTFVYLKRQVPLDVANEILAKKIPGLHWTREYIRSYPNGISVAQIVGLTGVDGNGIEGIELSAEKRLQGKIGSRRVMQDRLGRIIEDEMVREPQDGDDIVLTIDSRIQHLAYSLLENQVKAMGAKAGAVIVADPQTGDILALVNYPSFDPNVRQKINRQAIRNRAITDTYEPGSTMKPFAVAAGLEEKKVNPGTVFQIGKSMSFGHMSIGDSHYNKELTVSEIIKQSSNIGTSKISLLMQPQTMWGYYDKLGFGKSPEVGFPGAVAGRLRPAKSWRPVEQATMSYGHGVTVSLLQLVKAYTALARDGEVMPLSIYKDRVPAEPIRVYSGKTTGQMKKMLASVVEKGGTGTRAAVEGYSVAGKTGTAYKVENGQYVKKYISGFTGYAPAYNPRIVVGVMIDEPVVGKHFGSTAAAPLFAEIVEGSLRIMNVNPDKKPTVEEPQLIYAKAEPKKSNNVVVAANKKKPATTAKTTVATVKKDTSKDSAGTTKQAQSTKPFKISEKTNAGVKDNNG